MKIQQNHMRRLEKNEEEWFSLWCDCLDLGEALILCNTHFADDPLFNHATRVDSSMERTFHLVEKIVGHFQDRGLNPCIFVSPLSIPPNLAKILSSFSFDRWDQMFVLELSCGRMPAESGGLGVVRTVSPDAVRRWAEVFAACFDISDNSFPEVLKRSQQAASDPHTTLFLGYTDDKAVGTIALYRRDLVGGIYCLGTLAPYRRKGVASALLHHAIQTSFQNGDEVICLQTLGQDRLKTFYGRFGFRTAFTKTIYIKKND